MLGRDGGTDELMFPQFGITPSARGSFVRSKLIAAAPGARALGLTVPPTLLAYR